MSRPDHAKKTVKPCRSTTEIAELQRDALIENIYEAKKAEDKRIRDIARAPNQKRASDLAERHEAERRRDKTKIEYLLADLEAVQKATSVGDSDPGSRHRGGGIPPQSMDANRFKVEVSLSWINRLNELDKRFERRNMTRPNEYENKKKVTIDFDFLL